MTDKVTIQVSRATKKAIAQRGTTDMTYDQVLRSILRLDIEDKKSQAGALEGRPQATAETTDKGGND